MDDDIIKEYRPLKLTEKSARAFIRLDVEYHEKANKLRNEYLDKLAARFTSALKTKKQVRLIIHSIRPMTTLKRQLTTFI